ncbi:hypothetical protein H0H93_009194 [Arthromyces matolae]|nr:hypothetical protein H0H93_009194 [Arthromyces matolae]
MAPGRPVKVIKLKVPRHNAQRVGAKLGGEIKNLAKAQKIRAEIYQPSPEVSQAVESASEWNSMLITARAERGPQWDVGTQQTIDQVANRFLVDKYSDLYYDPTLLLEAVRKQTDPENAQEQPPQRQQHLPPHHSQHQSLSRHHTPRSDREFHMASPHHSMGPPGHDSPLHHRQHHGPPPNFPYPGTPQNMGMRGASIPRTYPGGHPGGGAPFNTSNQFFGGEGGSPMRVNPMGGMGMMDPGHSMGGMQGMGMGASVGGGVMGGNIGVGGMGGAMGMGGGMGGMAGGMGDGMTPMGTGMVGGGMVGGGMGGGLGGGMPAMPMQPGRFPGPMH